MKAQIGLVLTLVLFLLALPRLPLEETGTGQIFALSWLVFATVVLAAQLYQLVAKGVEEQERERQRKRLRQWRRTQRIQRAHRRRRTTLAATRREE